MDSTLAEIEKDFIALLIELSSNKDKNFSGLGLILYDDLNILSQHHCNLVNNEQYVPPLKLGTHKLTNYLVEISHYQHPYHDGFHFMNKQGVLTHVAQFFSPPIHKFLPEVIGQGARTYCSQCGSNIVGITLIGSISSKRNIHLFKKGKLFNEALTSPA